MRKIPACQKFQAVVVIVGVPEIFGRTGFFSLGSLEEKMLNLTLQRKKNMDEDLYEVKWVFSSEFFVM